MLRALHGYAVAILVVVLATCVDALVFGRSELADVVMVYLLGIVIVASRFGHGPSLTAAVLSVVAYDLFFVPPYFSFVVADLRHITTFGVMLVVATVISALAQRVRRQAQVAHDAKVQVETEQLRNALLSSVSHDLRTPLAVVKGAGSALVDGNATLTPEARLSFAESIVDEADRLNRLVGNLLDMTRLEAGVLVVKKEWQSIEELVGTALGRLEDRLRHRQVVVAVPQELPLVPCDALLVEQVLINLMENAARYTPEDTAVELRAEAAPGCIEIRVLDRGPGIPLGQEEKIFERFHRAHEGQGGIGLGLAICRGIVVAHGGSIWSKSRQGGGAEFGFTLPLGDDAPKEVP